MEQNPDVIATLVTWVAEQFEALAFGSIIGAIGAKWFFAKRNLEELGRLRREVDELKQERRERAPSPPSKPSVPATAAVPALLPMPTSAATSRDAGPESHSLVPLSSPPDALLSLEELLALVKGHTGMLADRLLKPHKGRRHHVRGVVTNVSEFSIQGVEVILDGQEEMMIVLWFKPGCQTEKLETLRQGDKVSATGLLRNASNHIAQEECVLDEVEINDTSLQR